MKHPIYYMEIGEEREFSTGDHGVMPPNVKAYKVTERTGRKFKCRQVDGRPQTWVITRLS